MPALPTTNLTAHFDASNAAHVWKLQQLSSPYHQTLAVDGDNTEVWDDEGDGSVTNIALTWGASWKFAASSAKSPTYKTATPLMSHSCLSFDGSTERYVGFEDNFENNTINWVSLIGAQAHTVIIAAYVEALSSNNASPFSNPAIMSENGGNFGLHLRTSAGIYYVQAYNYDGNVDVAEATFSGLNTSCVFTWRHDVTNLYVGVNGGTESSTPSAAMSVNANIYVGTNYDQSKFFQGRIGEIAIYNAALTGTNLTNANAYFTDKWLAAAGGAGKPHHYYQQMRRMAA